MQAAKRPFAEDDFGRKGEFADDLHPWNDCRPTVELPHLRACSEAAVWHLGRYFRLGKHPVRILLIYVFGALAIYWLGTRSMFGI